MSKDLNRISQGSDYLALDKKIREYVKTGSFDKITQSVAEFVSQKIEQNQSKKKKG